MLSASAYLGNLADFLEQHVGRFNPAPTLQVEPSDVVGRLSGTIPFPDGCELHVYALVDQAQDPLHPLALYSFHCQDRRKRCVVRLDNWPHHTHLPTFPDHVHEGPDERVSPHPHPTGREVVSRVLSYHDQHR